MNDIGRVTETAAERQAAARSDEEKVHAEWHRLFGDDCRKAGCEMRKEVA